MVICTRFVFVIKFSNAFVKLFTNVNISLLHYAEFSHYFPLTIGTVLCCFFTGAILRTRKDKASGVVRCVAYFFTPSMIFMRISSREPFPPTKLNHPELLVGYLGGHISYHL